MGGAASSKMPLVTEEEEARAITPKYLHDGQSVDVDLKLDIRQCTIMEVEQLSQSVILRYSTAKRCLRKWS